jgi:hypothetical protein
MSSVKIGTAPVHVDRPADEDVNEPDLPWIVIVWNDPINLMTYVTWVFMKLFGYPREKAERRSPTLPACTRTACGRRCRRTRDRGCPVPSAAWQVHGEPRHR